MEAFTAPMLTAPLLLDSETSEAEVASRPVRVAGGQPVAAVLLVEFEYLETAG